jgi:AraC-like DNA-binding protein
LNELRVDLAKRYLLEEDLAISKIAWLLGYQDVTAFTHAFKRSTGKSPREARTQEKLRSLNTLTRPSAMSGFPPAVKRA